MAHTTHFGSIAYGSDVVGLPTLPPTAHLWRSTPAGRPAPSSTPCPLAARRTLAPRGTPDPARESPPADSRPSDPGAPIPAPSANSA